ncbi:hypothetical protein M0P65_07105 [Candidatus Gracilibacteria bacterium]|jgi:hypothetical protein|nr:hypothetical protein [Candidatus Gracilibacteria bacterium]
MKIKKSELKNLIKEVINEDSKNSLTLYKEDELREIAFTKKGRWKEAIKKAGGEDKISDKIIDKFFNDLVNPTSKHATGLGAYIIIFQKLISNKFDKNDKIRIINKILNELPPDDYVLINISKNDFEKLPKEKQIFVYKVGNDAFYLKGLSKDLSFNIHGFGGGQSG